MFQASRGSCSHADDEVTNCWVSSCGIKVSVEVCVGVGLLMGTGAELGLYQATEGS